MAACWLRSPATRWLTVDGPDSHFRPRRRVNAAKRRRRRVRVDARSYKSTAAAITAVAKKRQAGAAAAKEVAIAEDANVNDILH